MKKSNGVLYLIFTQRTLVKLFDGSIPKLDISRTIMFSKRDSAIKWSQHESKRKIEEGKAKKDGPFCVCEWLYNDEELINMYFGGRFLPPIYWLIKSGIVPGENVTQGDRDMLEKIYETDGGEFEFMDIVITKENIGKIFSFNGEQINI